MAGAELSDVIGKLRDELELAMPAGENERLRFELGPVQVSLSVTVSSSGCGKAGVKFWVVEAGVEGSVSRATAQQITLTLNPKDTLAPPAADGSFRSPLVTGDVRPGEAG